MFNENNTQLDVPRAVMTKACLLGCYVLWIFWKNVLPAPSGSATLRICYTLKMRQGASYTSGEVGFTENPRLYGI
jgi:hypothetical protein